MLYEYDGMASKIETGEPSRKQAPRRQAELVRRSRQQRTELARLDQLESICREQRVGRMAVRNALGRRWISGMPPNLSDLDAFDLLDLPNRSASDFSQPVGDLLREFQVEGNLQASPERSRPEMDGN